ncbi:MAG TPA: nucleotide-binding protein [Xanthobacteraceae bacterium]|jgi:predicted nucleotide-binding protein|nr:nucleotide-binding protein [Xanthobacteraceae bacterium]
MSAKFYGSLDQLKDRLLPLDLDGEWQEQPNQVWKFRLRDKSGVLWSETKGTIWFDGPGPAKAALQAKVEPILIDGTAAAPASKETTIFVVHGRDETARDQLELILHRLGLEPYILQVSGGGGDTLIEVLEKMIGKAAQSSFGIVLATPDDIGYLKSEGQADAKARARQNVIMEMGMLMSSLTRRRCAILTKGYVEMPSNMGGVITIPFNDHVKEAVPKLVQRLQEAGFHLDPKAIGAAQS